MKRHDARWGACETKRFFAMTSFKLNKILLK